MGSCAAPSAKGDDKFITTDYLQQCPIDSLKPYLEKGDIIIDGGNTFFQDTIRRNRELSAEGFNFIGTGVSGGEEGAL